MNHVLTKTEIFQIRKSVEEDLGIGDITSIATIANDDVGFGKFLAKSNLILAGLSYAQAVFHQFNSDLKLATSHKDGDRLRKEIIFATVTGPLRTLLGAERLALNFLQHLSGIATLTSDYAAAVAGTKAKITDTRKTTPLWRRAEKYAVTVGGGVNHRMGLYDAILIKDNHIDACGSVSEAVRKSRKFSGPKAPIIVEIRKPTEIEEAIEAGATRLLLDNMHLRDLKKSVLIVNGRVPTEASGNITIRNVRSVALTGVDFISVGALTHSVNATDISFKVEKIR